MNILTEESGKFFPFFPQPFKLGLGRMLIDRDGEVRGFLAMEQHGQRLSHVLNKRSSNSHHIWQKQSYGNSPATTV